MTLQQALNRAQQRAKATGQPQYVYVDGFDHDEREYFVSREQDEPGWDEPTHVVDSNGWSSTLRRVGGY